jgi:hypothetical protein
MMGVSCVKSFGEAEALCAQLNEAGVSWNFSYVFYYHYILFFAFLMDKAVLSQVFVSLHYHSIAALFNFSVHITNIINHK